MPSKSKKKAMNRLSPETCFAYFIDGYIRNSSESQYFPSSLTSMIIEFVQTIFMNFDVYHEEYQHCILDKGFTFKRSKEIKNVFVIGSSKRNKGKHTFKIKLVQGKWENDAIGITKHIHLCKQRSIDFFNGYFWKGNHFCLTYGSGALSVYDMLQYPSVNDVISIHLDCKKWKLTFKLNGKSVHETENISPGRYHLIICSADQNNKYQLISKHVL
eukprot:124063_1